jgi:RNA polymerase-binding transcription factor DksA
MSKNNVEQTHYSDEELLEFKSIILEKLEIARQEFKNLNEAVCGNPNGTQGTFESFKVMEEAMEVHSKEVNARLACRQEKFIQCLEDALIRIENKTYGICFVTKKLISKERLRSVPHATKSIEGKEEVKKTYPKANGIHQLKELSSSVSNFR